MGTPWPAAAQTADQTGTAPTQQRDQTEPPPVDRGQLPRPGAIAPTEFDFSKGRSGWTQLEGPKLADDLACVESATDTGSPTIEATPAAQARMRVNDDLHRMARGADQKVAVIDTGVREHPRLAGRLIDGGDYVRNETALDDCDGHGTMVAGVIAADVSNATGFRGVAPAAEIISVRQNSRFYQVQVKHKDAEQDEARQSGDTTTMARAIMRAVQLDATVINISAAACAPIDQVQDGHAQDLQAAVDYAFDNNVVVVVAAGNFDESGGCPTNNEGGTFVVPVPAWFSDALTVAAVDSDSGQIAEFSVRGPWVDVAAPGTAITSLDPAGDELANLLLDAQSGETKPVQGTSFATPYVAGVAALVRERFPELSARQVVERIKRTAQQAPGQPVNPQTGHGVVDAVAALTAMIPEEHEITPTLRPGAPLDGLQAPPVKDPFPTRVGVVGASAGLGLLGLTMFVVYAVHRYRGRNGQAAEHRA